MQLLVPVVFAVRAHSKTPWYIFFSFLIKQRLEFHIFISTFLQSSYVCPLSSTSAFPSRLEPAGKHRAHCEVQSKSWLSNPSHLGCHCSWNRRLAFNYFCQKILLPILLTVAVSFYLVFFKKVVHYCLNSSCVLHRAISDNLRWCSREKMDSEEGAGHRAVLHVTVVGILDVCCSQKHAQVPFFHWHIKKLCRLSLVSLMDLKQGLA